MQQELRRRLAALRALWHGLMSKLGRSMGDGAESAELMQDALSDMRRESPPRDQSKSNPGR